MKSETSIEEMQYKPQISNEPIIMGLVILFSVIFLILIMLVLFGWFK